MPSPIAAPAVHPARGPPQKPAAMTTSTARNRPIASTPKIRIDDSPISAHAPSTAVLMLRRSSAASPVFFSGTSTSPYRYAHPPESTISMKRRTMPGMPPTRMLAYNMPVSPVSTDAAAGRSQRLPRIFSPRVTKPTVNTMNAVAMYRIPAYSPPASRYPAAAPAIAQRARSSVSAAATAAMPNGPQPENSRPAPSATPSRKYPPCRAAVRSAGLRRSAPRAPCPAIRHVHTAIVPPPWIQ